jgi:hypothetical protein
MRRKIWCDECKRKYFGLGWGSEGGLMWKQLWHKRSQHPGTHRLVGSWRTCSRSRYPPKSTCMGALLLILAPAMMWMLWNSLMRMQWRLREIQAADEGTVVLASRAPRMRSRCGPHEVPGHGGRSCSRSGRRRPEIGTRDVHRGHGWDDSGARACCGRRLRLVIFLGHRVIITHIHSRTANIIFWSVREENLHTWSIFCSCRISIRKPIFIGHVLTSLDLSFWPSPARLAQGTSSWRQVRVLICSVRRYVL